MPGERDLRAGIRVSWVSVAWTVLASSAAVVAGIRAKTLVLIAFGLTGTLDALGSLTIALHFRHAVARQAISPARERFALRLVSLGLLGVGLFTVVESLRRLITHTHAGRSTFGIAVAAASFVVLTVLSIRKRAVAARIPSRALRADGALSATGASLAIVTLIGTALAQRKGADWVDPTAALVVALAACAVGAVALRREADEL